MASVIVDGGVRLHVVREGPSDAETVVFVNGLTMDTGAWAAVARPLAERYATLRYDGRGQGRSDAPPGPYSPERHAADLEALLDRLGVERCHLVGLSNGALVAALVAGRLADRDPGRVLGVAAIAGYLTVDALLRTTLRGWLAALAVGGPGLRFDVATPWIWGHAFLAAHLDEVLAFRELAEAADPGAVRALIEGLLAFEGGAATLSRYRGPLLALVGADDVLTPPRHGRALIEAAPQGRLVVLDGVGHAAPIEAPEAVLAELHPFLAASGAGA